MIDPLGIGEVRRYELPKIRAFNIVIEDALAGGASRSLRLDSQGKALGVALLEMRVPGAAAPGRPSCPVTDRSSEGTIADPSSS